MSTSFKIEMKQCQKQYKNKLISYSNILIQKRVTVFVGENGSGKSTIFKAILGIIQYDGEIICPYSLSYMPEHPRFPLDITVTIFLEKLNQFNQDVYDYRQLLETFDLREKKDVYIQTLSKGMKAKLNLIQCLILDRDVYLLDEPFNGLDNKSVKTLIDIINHSDKRFLITSHIDSMIDQLNKEVIYL